MGDSTPVQSLLRLNREVAGKEWAAGPFSSQGATVPILPLSGFANSGGATQGSGQLPVDAR
jgi:hypothetical protein